MHDVFAFFSHAYVYTKNLVKQKFIVKELHPEVILGQNSVDLLNNTYSTLWNSPG